MTHERTVWIELPVQVEFNYQPFEPPERGPEAQYPGCPEAIEIEGCFIGRAEITGQLSEKEQAAILEALVDKMDLERKYL